MVQRVSGLGACLPDVAEDASGARAVPGQSPAVAQSPVGEVPLRRASAKLAGMPVRASPAMACSTS